ncbi:MAG TPA: EF-P beta-lysylation protein EpmB [Planctomycetaceae bacterium]|nr:EF-P beta-lysylation protein EpmB [Planctomycetaceae bacterium]
MTGLPQPLLPVRQRTGWSASLAQAIRNSADLLAALGLPREIHEQSPSGEAEFPVLVPQSYLARMRPGDPLDPLLRQVLPLAEEGVDVPGFLPDAVGDESSRKAPGLLHKYRGRALLVTTGACAVHCRYCFRRHYPYQQEPRRLEDWEPAFEALAADDSIHEVLLSGGDPLMLTDARLASLIERLEQIPHLRRLRLHSRLPIVLPDRVSEELLQLLSSTRLTTVMVVHANHPQEIQLDCADALSRLVRHGIPTLNQAVLLRGINDEEDVLAELCERLIDLGVLPYYLHQLDRVAGAAHFEVPVEQGRELVAALRRRLPGYAVPQYVVEIAGEAHKTPL